MVMALMVRGPLGLVEVVVDMIHHLQFSLELEEQVVLVLLLLGIN